MKKKTQNNLEKMTIYRAIFICSIITGSIVLLSLSGLFSSYYIADSSSNKPPIIIDETQYHIDGVQNENLSEIYPFIHGSGTFIDPYLLSGQIFNSEYRRIISISQVDDYFVISNITLNSLGWGSALVIEDCSNIIFTQNQINSTEIGITMHKCANISFSNNIFTNRAKISMMISSSENMTFINNTFSSARDGIHIWRSVNLRFQENTFYNNPQHALIDGDSTKNYYINNNFSHNRNGITLIRSSLIQIKNNVFEQNKIIAIGLYSSNDNEIFSNSIDKSRYGVSFALPWEDPDGIGLSASGACIDNIVSNNTFTNIGLKSIKNFIGKNNVEDNSLDNNVWALILIWIGSIGLIMIILFTGMAIIKEKQEFRKVIQHYKTSMNKEERISELEDELHEFKEKYFQLMEKKGSRSE